MLCSLRAMSRVCSWETKSASCHTGSESESCLGYWEDELLTWWVKLYCKVPLPSGVKDCGKTRLLWDGLAWPGLAFFSWEEGSHGASWDAAEASLFAACLKRRRWWLDFPAGKAL